ncbi:MAG: beta-lactamase family protein [Gammaproteobacteria bacterium]|nr:beta-lactamase family protein [Gammaproteobacteria bacterium]
MNARLDKSLDTESIHSSLDRWVHQDLIPSAASVVFDGPTVVSEYFTGHQDREREKPVDRDSIFRLFSNTKLITSVAAMILHEEGAFKLDDEAARYIPKLADLRVLKEDATDVHDTEPLESQITVRQLMSHTAGFSYGIFMDTPIDPLFRSKRVLHPGNDLEGLVEALATIPLLYQPGQKFHYSIATDVLGRLIEIWSGQSFGEFLASRIFNPLGMTNTSFYLSEHQRERLCVLYDGADPENPYLPGLSIASELAGDYFRPRALESGGGGLLGTISDYSKFWQLLIAGGTYDGVQLLQGKSLALMRTNQLPPGNVVEFRQWEMPNTVFGLGFALKQKPAVREPPEAIDEYYWGGIAGTHSWIAPRANVGVLLFTQRLPGYWLPFFHEHKRAIYGMIRTSTR